MNGQKFHLFDATIDLFDPFEVNSDCRNSDVKPLFLRVIVVICAYFQGPLAVTGGSSTLAQRDCNYQARIDDTSLLTRQVISEQIAAER